MDQIPTHPDIVPLAQAFGVTPQGVAVELPCGRFPCVVSLQISSGVVGGLSLHVRCHPLPPMYLRAESAKDTRDKATGINVEVQTGDAEFDRRVYVETDAPPHVARATLASPEARRAIAQLIAEGHELRFDHRGILTSIDGKPDAARLRRVVELLAWIAWPMPVFSEADREDRSRHPLIAAALFFLIPMLLMLLDCFLLIHYELVSVLLPALLGGLGGLLLAAPVMAWAYFFFRHRSDSLSKLLPSLFGIAVSGPLAGFAFIWGVNCVADLSPPVTHDARAVNCDLIYDASNARVTLKWGSKWNEWAKLTVDDCTPYEDDDRNAFVTIKPGALGFPWVANFGPK